MKGNHLLNQLHYRSEGKRSIGRPEKRCVSYNCNEKKTGINKYTAYKVNINIQPNLEVNKKWTKQCSVR